MATEGNPEIKTEGFTISDTHYTVKVYKERSGKILGYKVWRGQEPDAIIDDGKAEENETEEKLVTRQKDFFTEIHKRQALAAL